MLHAATAVSLGQVFLWDEAAVWGAWDRRSSGTKQQSGWHTTAQALLAPGAWGALREGSTAESLQCTDSAGGHHPEKETRLKQNKREPATRAK